MARYLSHHVWILPKTSFKGVSPKRKFWGQDNKYKGIHSLAGTGWAISREIDIGICQHKKGNEAITKIRPV